MDNFLNKYKQLALRAEVRIRAALDSVSPSGLQQACAYSALAPGKRFRPVLSYLTAELLEIGPNTVQDALQDSFAAALEFIHSASLVHDDLPALDNDTLRRGQPTTHVKFGEDVAILAGDALFALALKTIAESGGAGPGSGGYGADCVKSAVSSELCALLSSAYFQVCLGQYYDLYPAAPADLTTELTRKTAEVELCSRHKSKTGALIAAAAGGPAIIAGASGSDSAALQQFGAELGLLFQITDDLLDATSTAEALGKHSGTDQRHGRVTFVTLFGIDGAAARAELQAASALAQLERWGDRAADLRQLVQMILHRSR